MSNYVAYPCGCQTDDSFKGERCTCKHGNSYRRRNSISQGLQDNLDKRNRERKRGERD